MENENNNKISDLVIVFHERWLPERATPAGYAALIDSYDLKVPIPNTLSAIGQRHKVYEKDGWRIFTPRHAPSNTFSSQLTFAMKHEGIDLAVLKRLFEKVGAEPIAEIVRQTPTGSYARRIWFLYEWLTGTRLDLPDADQGAYASVVDEKLQYGSEKETSSRHRVKNNLPGTPAFCPMVFRTQRLEEYIKRDLAKESRAVISRIPSEVMARAAAFLLLSDSKSSYAIEGKSPPQNRIQRWGRAIGQAGKWPLSVEELLRLQRMVIEDDRFVNLGLREQGGFVGEHDRSTFMPLPEHISARPEDLSSLVDGLVVFDRDIAQHLDPVITAAVLAFGFVYMHPFEDGNGRVHRYLIHHALARQGFNPPGVVFPVSSVILDKLETYRSVLEDYSKRLLPIIDWEATGDGNVRVLVDTADYYRFFDATAQAEFLYECVAKTIEKTLPQEAGFLQRYDRFKTGVKGIVDLPDRTLDLLFRFLGQNQGRLSKRAREHEFAKFTEEEIDEVERIYGEE